MRKKVQHIFLINNENTKNDGRRAETWNCFNNETWATMQRWEEKSHNIIMHAHIFVSQSPKEGIDCDNCSVSELCSMVQESFYDMRDKLSCLAAGYTEYSSCTHNWPSTWWNLRISQKKVLRFIKNISMMPSLLVVRERVETIQ